MPSRCAAAAPSTTTGLAGGGRVEEAPRASVVPTVAGRLEARPPATATPPVLTAGIDAVAAVDVGAVDRAA